MQGLCPFLSHDEDESGKIRATLSTVEDTY